MHQVAEFCIVVMSICGGVAFGSAGYGLLHLLTGGRSKRLSRMPTRIAATNHQWARQGRSPSSTGYGLNRTF
jgi:hypothetical protein